MRGLAVDRDRDAPLQVLCLGAHADDIEIGCGGTVLRLAASYPRARFTWVVLSARGERRREAECAWATDDEQETGRPPYSLANTVGRAAHSQCEARAGLDSGDAWRSWSSAFSLSCAG